MKHNIQIERFGVRLRPVRLEDAGFIVRLRNSPHALGNVGDSACDLASQEDWLERYFQRPGDYYFIVEKQKCGTAVGTWGIYDIENNEGEGGRWIIVPESSAAPASIWLGYHLAFEILRLDAVLGSVVETNRRVLAFHTRIGNPSCGRKGERLIGGRPVAMVNFRATTADWTSMSAKLVGFAAQAENYV